MTVGQRKTLIWASCILGLAVLFSLAVRIFSPDPRVVGEGKDFSPIAVLFFSLAGALFGLSVWFLRLRKFSGRSPRPSKEEIERDAK